MIFLRAGVLILLLSTCSSQQYDFGAEITRQCLVPDPVGLLDCVENKVTLPYLTSWVDCTNSLGQNVKTSADIINYRCKSVWEGKPVIPEVFYIKDCVIEKTGLPAKNVSAEVLGAYKECESSPKPPVQQVPVSFSGVKTAPIQQHQIDVSGRQPVMQQLPPTQPVQQIRPVVQPSAPQPILPAPRPVQQPYSQQFFVLYPQAPLPLQVSAIPVVQQQRLQQTHYVGQLQQTQQQISQQQLSNVPIFQQQSPTDSYAPQTQQFSFPVTNQQKMPATSFTQTQFSQQQLPVAAYTPQSQQIFQAQGQAFGPVLNTPYRYEFQIRHPQQHSIKM